MAIKSQKDFFSGLLFMAVGVAFRMGCDELQRGHWCAHGAWLLSIDFGHLHGYFGRHHHFQIIGG